MPVHNATVVQVRKVSVAIFSPWRSFVFFFLTNHCSSKCNHVKKNAFFLWDLWNVIWLWSKFPVRLLFRKVIEKISLENYLFQRITTAIFFLRKYVVGIHYYTSNFSLKRGKLSEKSYFIRFWKEKVPTFLCFHLKEREKYFPDYIY